MILSSLQHTDSLFVWLPKPLQTAVNYLKNTDFSTMEKGVHEVQSKDILAIVDELTTKPVHELRPESHRRYIDVQYVWQGHERMGVTNDTGKYEVVEDRLKKDDVQFFRSVENETFIDVPIGTFAIFFPTDIHRPGCIIDTPAEVKKVIMKVAVALLK